MTEENMLSQNTSSDDIKAHGTDETADFSYDGYQVVRLSSLHICLSRPLL